MNRRAIKILIWIWALALGALAVVMVTKAQSSGDLIRALTDASNNANMTILMMLFVMGLPFLWWYLSGRRLDRMERIMTQAQEAEARRVKTLEIAIERRDKQLENVISEFKDIVRVMNRRAAGTERNIGILEKSLSLHNREADARTGKILDGINDIVRQSEQGRLKLRRDLADQQNAMMKDLGRQFNLQFAAMSKLLAGSIDNLASKLPITVVQTSPPPNIIIPQTGELSAPKENPNEEA